MWNLVRPVHRGESARPSPLRALARVSEYYATAIKADAGYNGVLAHNPMSTAHGPGFVTNWFYRVPYTLPALSEVIPFRWRKPTVPSTAIGRNCALFDALMRWAGSEVYRDHDVLAAALAANQDFGIPLEAGEVAGIAKSVGRYRKRWTYYTPEQRTLWGCERGIRSGTARRKRTAERDRAIVQAVASGRSLRGVDCEAGGE